MTVQTPADAETHKKNEPLAQASTFFAGVLLYKFHNPIEVSLFIGTLLGNIINWSFFAIASGTINKVYKVDDDKRARDKEHIKRVISYFMIFFLFLMFSSSIYMYRIYITGDDFGYLNQFYFSLILITLFDGFTNAFAFALNGKNASFLAAGIPTSGALVSLLHNIYKFFSDLFHWDDFDYIVLGLQLIFNVIQLFITIVAWLAYLLIAYTNNDSTATFMNKHYPKADTTSISPVDLSPICLLAFSLGTVYVFYPSIAPYSIIDYQYASVIELLILVISSSPTVIVAILDILGSITYKQINNKVWGPGGKLNQGSITHNWAGLSGDRDVKYWNCIWMCAIPYILCIQILMSMLHYPDSLLSCFFNDPLRIGFISVLFNTVRELMQACAFSGAGKQVAAVETVGNIDSTNLSCTHSGSGAHTLPGLLKRWQTNPETRSVSVNGTIAVTNKLITLFVMMFCVFTGDGYLQHYRRCCRDCWPTTGYTRYQSLNR